MKTEEVAAELGAKLKCIVKGCESEGNWTADLLVYTNESSLPVARLANDFRVCGPHAYELKVENILDDDNFEELAANKELFKDSKPIREKTRLVIRKIV